MSDFYCDHQPEEIEGLLCELHHIRGFRLGLVLQCLWFISGQFIIVGAHSRDNLFVKAKRAKRQSTCTPFNGISKMISPPSN